MSAPHTKFYLDKRNGKFMGVCAGIADYTGVDVTVVRIGTILLTILGSGMTV
ncbi:MAG TPA: PspC domain-containing protein, partial [Allosphingosinicella sp.]|nr:PspC domain-containing protein [Allosphingosinicella sp.]